jgi:phosphate transport system substrate-binding protein
LKFDGPTLAGIYTGAIRTWNAPQIAALNPGVKLPANPIVPVHRSDGSGDTFLFSQFLSLTTPTWASSLHYGPTINWPAVQGEIGAQGNAGMVTAGKTPYSIIYVGISFRGAAGAAGLGEAALVNKAGKPVVASAATVSAAVAASRSPPPDQRVSLIFGSGANSYPIINYEYGIVKQQQPAAPVAGELKSFLTWAISPAGGNSPANLSSVGFQPLPAAVRARSGQQIASIH